MSDGEGIPKWLIMFVGGSSIVLLDSSSGVLDL